MKDTTIKNLNIKIFGFEQKNVEFKAQINVLKSETNHIKEKTDQFKTEIKNNDMNHAKDRANLIETLSDEARKIENTYNILKGLYENQQTKYFKLLKAKETLKEDIKIKERAFKIKTGVCETCFYCRRAYKTKPDLKNQHSLEFIVMCFT